MQAHPAEHIIAETLHHKASLLPPPLVPRKHSHCAA
jgi:hypothetical protein